MAFCASSIIYGRASKVFGKRWHAIFYNRECLGVYRTFLLLGLHFMASTTILRGDNSGNYAALVLKSVRIILIGLMTVETVYVGLRMGAILPLMSQAGRGFCVAVDAGLTFFQTPTIGIQINLGCHYGCAEQYRGNHIHRKYQLVEHE